MRRVIVLTTLVVAIAGPSAASASPQQVITDCNTHDQLTGHYSSADLRDAIAILPADVKEYTDCYDVIQRALLAQLSASGRAGGTASPSSGGSFLPIPVIAVLVLLVLGGAALAVAAARRRGRGDGGSALH